MTGAVECRYYGRDFSAGEMALLRTLIAGPPALNRHRLSKEFCRRTGWFKPDGGLKDMMARVTMLDMHRDGLIVLPPKQGRQNRPKPIVFGPDTEAPLFPAPTALEEVRPLHLRPVVRGTREGKLWNEFVARYHYLGYKTLVGAQMRYAVHDRNGWPVAMLGFSTAAWKLAPRDKFIGWTPQMREKNLPLVVDNPRFLILPWINIPNLGSQHPRHRPPPPARGLDRALQHDTRAHRDLRRDPALHRRGLQGIGLGLCWSHPRGAVATTDKSFTTSPGRTSGSGPSEGIGNAPSTARIHRPIPAQPNLYGRVGGVVTEPLPVPVREDGACRSCIELASWPCFASRLVRPHVETIRAVAQASNDFTFRSPDRTPPRRMNDGPQTLQLGKFLPGAGIDNSHPHMEAALPRQRRMTRRRQS